MSNTSMYKRGSLGITTSEFYTPKGKLGKSDTKAKRAVKASRNKKRNRRQTNWD